MTSEASANETIVLQVVQIVGNGKEGLSLLDIIMAGDFTFTSPVDDHISKSAYKKGCWDTQIAFVDKFDLELVTVEGNEALVKYLCHTKNGKSFRNVEYFRLSNQRIEALECYFGGNLTYPSAVSSQKS